jgi:hypothetical protein
MIPPLVYYACFVVLEQPADDCCNAMSCGMVNFALKRENKTMLLACGITVHCTDTGGGFVAVAA